MNVTINNSKAIADLLFGFIYQVSLPATLQDNFICILNEITKIVLYMLYMTVMHLLYINSK